MKPTKKQLIETKLSKDLCEQCKANILLMISQYPDKAYNRPFLFKLINSLFKSSKTIEEKAYYYRFNMANQLFKKQEEVSMTKTLIGCMKNIYGLCIQMGIDVNSLNQFMLFPDENTKISAIIM